MKRYGILMLLTLSVITVCAGNIEAAKASGMKFSADNKTLLRCPNYITAAVIPSGVTAIGKSAFQGCRQLNSVTIPDSVTSIGEMAFYGCKNLSSLTIPDSVISIGRLAFSSCENISSLTIPDRVESIGAWAFLTVQSIKVSQGNSSFRNGSAGEVIDIKNKRLIYVPPSFPGLTASLTVSPLSATVPSVQIKN